MSLRKFIYISLRKFIYPWFICTTRPRETVCIFEEVVEPLEVVARQFLVFVGSLVFTLATAQPPADGDGGEDQNVEEPVVHESFTRFDLNSFCM